MPFSRDPRKDRRRRVLRETVPFEDGSAAPISGRIRTRGGSKSADEEEELDNQPRRSAGYSQDVRRTCQHRLVQLIPVRRRAYLATIFVSCLIPAVLLTGHYMVYVSGSLRLYGNPLAVMLDAGHARGICAWLCSQLWLLCLGATVLTFRLRRHKLDDYQGEYRLWFWLVTTCIVGSIDSTTGITEIFGLSLDRWSQLNLGWSGKAVVQATLATLIGILGLRLCSELKNVPTSLMFWLLGLIAWAASATLSQELFKIDLSSQFRYWLRSALWIGGMTSIWLSALAFLRSVYIDAQRRFLLRGHLAESVSKTWGERVTASMPSLPSLPRISLRRSVVGPSGVGTSVVDKAAVEQQVLANTDHSKRKRFAMPSLFRKKPLVESEQSVESVTRGKKRTEIDLESVQSKPQTVVTPPLRRADAAAGNLTRTSTVQPATVTVASRKADSQQADPPPAIRRSWLGRLVPAPKNVDESPEYAKQGRSDTTENKSTPAKTLQQRAAGVVAQRKIEKSPADTGSTAQTDDKAKKRGWLPKLTLPKPKLPSIPRPRLPKMPKFSLPKLKLPSLRLPPPESSDAALNNASLRSDLKPVSGTKPLPGTNGPTASAIDSNGRPLSKAERKRMRKIQDDQDSQRRAA